MWKLECQKKGYVNRPGWNTANKRRAAKLEGNKTWFQKKPGGSSSGENKKGGGKHRPIKRYESVLFCPYTPGSQLKKQLQAVEDQII